MNLLTPWTAGIAAAIAVPSLLLLYFLKLRRREVPISSTMLWKKAVQDLQVNAPFQRLRKNLLLFLQLLVLALVIFALGTPLTKWTGKVSRKIVMLIDHSASMNTLESGQTRLEIAKAEALEYLRGIKSTDEAMVIGFAEEARPLCDFTSDHRKLRRAIESIEPTDARTELSEALKLAVAYSTPPGHVEPSMAAQHTAPPAQIELFSDGRIADAEEVVIQRGTMRYFPIGKADDNVGIVTLDVRRAYEQPSLLTIFAVVENFGPNPVKTDVSLRVNGKLEHVREIALGPATPEGRANLPSGGARRPVRHAVAFELVEEEGGGTIEIRIEREDALEVDNVVIAPIDPPRRVNVLIVTDRPITRRFIQRALGGMPVQQVDFWSTEEYDARDDADFIADGRPIYDVTIIDNHSTAKLPPGGYLFFGGVPLIEGVSLGEMLEDDRIATWDETHAILRYVNFDNIYIARWRELSLPPYAVPLVEGERSPVIGLLPTPGRQYVIAAFDLLESDWLMRVPFVVYIYNSIRYLSTGGLAQTGQMLRPGQTFVAPPMRDTEEITIKRPDGDEDTISVAGALQPIYARTHQAGMYTMTAGDEQRIRFAVNLLDANESRIAVNLQLEVGGEERIESIRAEENINQPLWPWLFIAALIVMILEWWVYNRRVVV